MNQILRIPRISLDHAPGPEALLAFCRSSPSAFCDGVHFSFAFTFVYFEQGDEPYYEPPEMWAKDISLWLSANPDKYDRWVSFDCTGDIIEELPTYGDLWADYWEPYGTVIR